MIHEVLTLMIVIFHSGGTWVDVCMLHITHTRDCETIS
jgi:hypothetical protein